MHMGEALVWIIRRDGWMRRVVLGTPLPEMLCVGEKGELSLAGAALPTSDRPFTTRRFQRMRLETPKGVDWLPWFEPYYYREV